MSTLNILACQIKIPVTACTQDRDQHLQRSAEKASQWLNEHPANILLLPELSTLEYSNTTFSNLLELAEDDHDVSFKTWSKVAKTHQCFVLYGYARRRADKEISNNKHYSISTGIINPRGELQGIYEKMHLAQFGASEEKDYFCVSGESLFVFECNGFKLSPIICYDIRFPELCRTLAVKHKVDCILHTGAYARDASFASWHAFAKTRAMENQIYFVSLNRAGEQFGQSIFLPPWVDADHTPTKFEDTAEQCQLLTLTREAIDSARQQFQFLGDRLADYDLQVTTVTPETKNRTNGDNNGQ